MRHRLLFLAALCHTPVASGLDNGVGLTPAMGWNSWNRFRCEGLNEDLILEVAMAMVDSGLRDAGYKYVNIDDCWMERRGDDGHIVPHPKKFPSGMKALGDKIHRLGMKFGIYSCAGEKTCEGWPGSYGYEKIDAADYASWGVDYLKYDFCGFEKVKQQQTPRHYYTVMRDALNATGRPILYSMCNWGVGQPHLWGHEVANSWRTGRDVFAAWDEHAARSELRLPGFLQSIETAIEQQATYAPHARPGAFNDPDMLVVGLDGMVPYGIVEECPSHLPKGSCKKGDYVSRELWGTVGGLTYTEQRAQFSFWCMLAAPLMLGNDPRTMSSATKRILTAPEMLAINQDVLAIQAGRVRMDAETRQQVWLKRLADGSHAVLIFNGGTKPADVTVRWDTELAEASRAWAVPVAREPKCENKHEDKGCDTWAKGGECEKNPGFMKSNCLKSCDACPPALWEGKQATALVRNAWEREFEGYFTALYTAKHVEPHEARVLVVRFGEKKELEMIVREDRDRRTSNPGGVYGGSLGTAHTQPLAHELSEAHSSINAALPHLETHHHSAPPTLSACASEHMDSLLGGALMLLFALGVMMLLLGKLVRGELLRTRYATPIKRTMRYGNGKDRPHAV